MNQELQHRLQAWVDGELDPDSAREVAAWVAQEPAARMLADNLRQFSQVLREADPILTLPESREFYWSKIRRGIEQAERLEARTEVATRATPNPLRWLAWLLPAGAAALAAVFFLRPSESFPVLKASNNIPTLTQHEVETPSSEVTSLTFYSAQEGLTVVWLGSVDFL